MTQDINLLASLEAQLCRVRADIAHSTFDVEYAQARLNNDLKRLSMVEDQLADLAEYPPVMPANFPMMDKCDEKAKIMPHFTLLAKDKLALICIEQWLQLARRFDVAAEKISEGQRV